MFVALTISAVAEFYSIVGLTAIFSAAFWPIVIMGASLGVGKVTAAVWLKLNWERASWTYKLYLVPAVAFLMVLTSMGIFGFLSKAHSDQSMISGDSMAKVAIYDEKINTAKDNIATNRKALKQMDEAVDQVMGRSADEKGADKAVSIRRAQAKERSRLLAEIEVEQRKVAQLSEERAPLAAEFRKVESEVGPIKYIAALVYGDNPDANILERAVRLVIILIVAVFDPLALVLILAAQQTLRWAKEDKEQKREFDEFGLPEPVETPPMPPLVVEPEKSILQSHPYLLKPFSHFKDTTPLVYKPEATPEIKIEYDENGQMKPLKGEQAYQLMKNIGIFDENGKLAPEYGGEEEYEDDGVDEEKFLEDFDANLTKGHETESPILTLGIDEVERPGDYITPPEDDEMDEDHPHVKDAMAKWKAANPEDTLKNQRNKLVRGEIEQLPWMKLLADNELPEQHNSGFGTVFPANPGKGDTFVRVDQFPNVVYKYNGHDWIVVDKNLAASYTYDSAYIDHLINKIGSGEYDPDLLSESEREQVAERLQQNSNSNT